MNNFLKKAYKKIFPDWTAYLQREAQGCDSLLDLACGYNSLAQFLDIKHKVGVEMFEDYLKQSREKKIHDEYFQANILTIEFPPRSYDLILASEIIEHLDKPDGFILLNNAERWAKKKVVITTPNGYVKQDSYDDNPLQIHKSGWNIGEFKQRGYRVYGIGGLKFLRGERGELKYKPYALWRVINDICQKIVYHFPDLAFQLLAVKDIKQDE